MSITTIPLLRDLQGDWAQLRVTLVGPDAPAEPVILRDVFPFLSITDFKRLLWIQQEGNPRWAPERVFVGVRGASSGLRPLEFYWSALVTGGITELPDPLIQPRVPSPALVDETGARRPIGPTMIGSLTLEAALAPEIAATGELPQIVAISLDALTPAAEEALTPALFGGFYQLYFPWLTAPGEVLEVGDAKEAYAAALLYTEDRTGRIAVAQRLLERGAGGDSITMTTMVRLRWMLPPPNGKPDSLERTFYALKASPVLPFLRYFPYGAGTTPLLKLALKADGSPVLDDEKVFAQYLNQPAPTMKSAVILARVPLMTAHAERGTAFTIYMFEDGHSDITLEVPQRGMSYIAAVAKDAEAVLAALLPALGFPENAAPRLVDLHATYRWSHPNPQQATPLSANRIAARISALTPFLDLVPIGKDDKALAVCKWRAVSNYESETEQFAYITQMILRGGGMSDGLSALSRYVTDIRQRFGITEADAEILLEQWTERRGSAVAPAVGPAAGQWAVPRHAIGALIAITGTHPEYMIEIQNVDSVVELQRAVSVVGAVLGARSAELAITAPSQPIVATSNAISMSNAAQEQMAMVHGPPPEEEAEEEIQFDPVMDELMAELGFGGAEDIGEEEAPAPAPVLPAVMGEPPAPDVEAIAEEEGGDTCMGTPWKAGEPALKSLDQYYIKRLNEADSVLFGSWKGKAQDMSSVAATGRGKLFSKSCQGVRQPNIMTLAAYTRVRRCYADRVRFIDLPPQKPDDLPRDLAAEAEFFVGKRASRKRNHVEDYLKRMESEEFLVDKVTGKPMWSVFSYTNKTRPGEFMYVMCAELWCERDNLPLERGEFESTQGRGFTKEPNTCPFCGGRPIQDLAAPMSGESVIVRKAKAGAAEPRFIGTMRTRHPAGYELPCCDGTPDLIKGFLRVAIQGEITYEKEVAGVSEEEEGDEATASVTYMEGAPTVSVDYGQRLSSMHTQYILNYDKALEAGKIGLLPPALDAFFGQSSQRSVESRGIRPTFVKGATVFVRVGVDTRIRTPGLNLFAGLAPLLNFETAEETRAFLKEQITVAAFEAANYGTLVHEFAMKSQLTEDQISGAIQTFASANNYFLDRNRAHVVRVMRAWDAFNRYIDDIRTPKQLRHFEHMLAYPGLIQPRGLLLVVLEQVGDQIRIACPSFGIPLASMFGSVPVAFMWHDVRDESWEPIVLYNGTKDAVRFFSDRMPDVPSPQREAIQSWLADWRSSSIGCGRPAPPPHVWSPNRDTSGLPRLSNIVNWRPLRTRAILRDRSNRLAGVIAESRTKPGVVIYVPALDDGLLVALPRAFEAEMIPAAPTVAYIEIYRELAAQYQALTPTRYLMRGSTTVGFQIANGTMIPLVTGDVGPELPERPQAVDEFPWERDAILLRAPDAPALDTVALGESMASVEEQLSEAYQHLRLSLGRWLIRDAAGPTLRAALTKLIDSAFPLYEKRKRMDILLEPVVRRWVLVEQTDARRSMSLLREDCLSLQTEAGCAAEGACRWSGGRCMIHAPTKDAAVTDPVRIFTARLSDELLRFTAKRHELLDDDVDTIRTPRGPVRVGNELYMSTKPKEAAATILRRLGFAGQAALTFPEEMLRFDGLEEEEPPLPPPEEDQVSRRDLPATWSALGFQIPSPVPGLEGAKQLAFAEGTGRTIEQWADYIRLRRKKFGLSGDVNRPFQWSTQDFYVIAIITLCSIVFVRQTKEGQLVVDRWINPPGAKGTGQQFIIFWGPQQLLVTRAGRYRFMLDDLPPELRAALDTVSPMTDEEARGTLEEIASPPASDEGSPASSVVSGESDIMPALDEIGGLPAPPQPAASMESEVGQLPAPQYATSIEGVSLA